MIDWQPLILTLRLALVTTIILLAIGIPLAYWLVYSERKYKFIVETLVSMPLVLPPSVLGFYLLIGLSPNSWLGSLLFDTFSIQFVFTFEGLVLASIIFSLPFMIQPIVSGLKSIDESIIEMAYTLGKSKMNVLFRVLLPNIKASLLSGVVLSFAHTIGEFGVVLMIGGNIPGRTRVASLAIYDEVEALNYDTANQYALILFAVSFSILLVVNIINKKRINVF